MPNRKLRFDQLEPRWLMTAAVVHVPMDGFHLEDMVDPPDEPASLVSGPSHGRGDVHPSGVVGYAPDIGFRGADTMVVGLTGGEDLDITFVVGNRPPDAVNDVYTTSMNTPLLEAAPGFLGNDSDPDGDPLTARIDVQPGHGVALTYSTGHFVYWPEEGFVGADQFTYAALDPWGAETTAVVDIQVVATAGITRTFEVHNTQPVDPIRGTHDLVLTGDPLVQIGGPNASDFIVTEEPAQMIPAGGNTSFDILFTPSQAGIRTATVTVPNNDSNEGGYTFFIQGTGATVAGGVDAISLSAGNYGSLADEALDELLDSSLLPELLPDLLVDLADGLG